jgi:hypothetical protein
MNNMNEMFFPSSEIIEKVITDDSTRKYGTNLINTYLASN